MTPAELRRHLGDISQLVSTREIRLGDGNEDGVRAVDVRVSDGLSALVLADRGLDIGPLWAAGHQLSWQSPTGIVHPAYFDEAHWLRSFHGGMLVTCGLQNVGPGGEVDGVVHGLHGRVSNIPAHRVTHRVVEIDGRFEAQVSGEVRETDVFGSDLLLRRTIRFPFGERSLRLHDEVENLGHEPAVLMILYHVNVGYPVVAEGARLLAPPVEVVGRDEPAQAAIDERGEFPPPRDGFRELVYEYRLEGMDDDEASIGIANPRGPGGGIALTVSWDRRQLPRLWHWRMLGPGMYVTGLEPANCGLRGRAAEDAAGGLERLAPGETRAFDLRLDVHLGAQVEALLGSA